MDLARICAEDGAGRRSADAVELQGNCRSETRLFLFEGPEGNGATDDGRDW